MSCCLPSTLSWRPHCSCLACSNASRACWTYVNLQSIAYYALKHELISDPTLVFVLRKVDSVLQTTWMGDQYSPDYGVDVRPMTLCRDDQC